MLLLPGSIAEIILQFDHPVPAVIQQVVKREIAAKHWLSDQKSMPSTLMNTLFGKGYLATIKQAEDGVVSYDKAMDQMMLGRNGLR